jgi:hypothetical protein
MKRRLFFFCAIATVTGILIGFLAKEFYWFFLVPLFFIPLVVYRKRTDFIVIILLFTLFSCNSKQTYVEQDIVNFNYNNISTGASPYWIDNEVVCFSEHSLVWNLYFVDSQGKL